MEPPPVARVAAVNAHWTGILRLSSADGSVMLEGPGIKGHYRLANRELTIFWDSYPPEVFLECSGRYVAEALLQNQPRLEELFAVKADSKPVIASRIHLIVDPRTNYEVALRLRTTDILAFNQIFVANDYDSVNLPASADTIVDLGANVGLATVFFGLRYPQARILSVEPDQNNFNAMTANVAALGDRVRKQHAAVWSKDGFVSLHTRDPAGRVLGEWEVRVSDKVDRADGASPCYRLTTLLDIADFASVDILKVDIEGAEFEIFGHEAADWLARTNLIIIETHDRFRPGAESAVRAAIAPLFEELPGSGENLFFRRRRTTP